MPKTNTRRKLPARERILLSAHRLFNEEGAQNTGIDKIIRESEVAKMSFYAHFPSKSDLIFEYFEQKDFEWFELLQRHIRKGESPREKLLRIFEALEEWFAQDGFNGCPFIRGLAEFRSEEHQTICNRLQEHFSKTEHLVFELCRDFRAVGAEELALQFLQLLYGAIVLAQTRNLGSAESARMAAAALLSKDETSR